MGGQRSESVGALARAADRAEIDGLQTVVAASLVMAERLRSEAASTLLRRALALLEELGHETASGSTPPRRFIRS